MLKMIKIFQFLLFSLLAFPVLAQGEIPQLSLAAQVDFNNNDINKGGGTLFSGANVYFFYGDGCPHCAAEEILLNKIEAENKNIIVHRYEVFHNSRNADFLSELGGKFDWDLRGVPFTVVG